MDSPEADGAVQTEPMTKRGWRSSVHLPFAAVTFVAVAGLVWVSFRHWRQGAMLVGCALVLAALLRAFLPDERVGLLAIRSRTVDIVLYTGLGLLILWVAATITGGFGA